jgi:transcriptional regulator with XRE-family HTH domain
MATPIGEKLKSFRTRAGLSQLDVEVACDMSSGMLSRIEKGLVNPTKETIRGLAQVLKLSQNELADLFDIRPLYPSQTEIDEAIAVLKERFDREDVFAYLLDEWITVYSISKGFINVMGLTPEHLKKIYGRSMCEVIFDPEIPIGAKIDPNYMNEGLLTEIARLIHNIPSFEESELYGRLMKIPQFPPLYEKAKSLSPAQLTDPLLRMVNFTLGGQKVVMVFNREKVKSSPRFDVIEFVSPQIYGKQ